MLKKLYVIVLSIFTVALLVNSCGEETPSNVAPETDEQVTAPNLDL